jgi:DNA-binding response OmpR family regulator
MMNPYSLLVIARNQSLAERLRKALDADRYRIRQVPCTSQALGLKVLPSLLILEMPPSGGTRSVTRLKHRFSSPLLVLLRPGQSAPELADSCLYRPFEIEQLVQLVQAALMASAPHVLRAGGITLDTTTRRLQLRGDFYHLPPISCQILALLIGRAGKVVRRDELFNHVWQTDDGDRTRVLDVHIAQLRRLLEPDPRHPTLICTERGVGYCLRPPS